MGRQIPLRDAAYTLKTGLKLFSRRASSAALQKDKQYKDITSDSAIFQVQKYYKTKEDIPNLTLASFYCGRLLQEKKEFKKAASFYIQAEKYAAQNSNTYLKGLIQYYLGTIYYDQQSSCKYRYTYRII